MPPACTVIFLHLSSVSELDATVHLVICACAPVWPAAGGLVLQCPYQNKWNVHASIWNTSQRRTKKRKHQEHSRRGPPITRDRRSIYLWASCIAESMPYGLWSSCSRVFFLPFYSSSLAGFVFCVNCGLLIILGLLMQIKGMFGCWLNSATLEPWCSPHLRSCPTVCALALAGDRESWPVVWDACGWEALRSRLTLAGTLA